MSGSALVLVDLQRDVVARLADRDVVLRACVDAAEAFLAARLPVVLVRVLRRPGGVDTPRGPGLATHPIRPALLEGSPGAAFVDELAGLRGRCHEVVKRRRSAFTGTDLDVLLRALAVDTVFLGGVDTTLGVESTARSAYDLGYRVVVLADCCRAADPEAHAWAIERVLPRMATVGTGPRLAELLAAAARTRAADRADDRDGG